MISVIIPLFNKRLTIVDTVTSVLTQSFSDFELIVVNDGSSDGGEKLVEAIADSRIRLIHQQNRGVSAARNCGAAAARGEWLAFLDGDDLWAPDYLKQMFFAARSNPGAVMICCAGYVTFQGRAYLRLIRSYEKKIIPIDYFRAPEVFSHTSATMIRREFFQQTSGFREGVSRWEDLLLFCEVALSGLVVYCGIPLSVYQGGIPGQLTECNRKTSSAERGSRDAELIDLLVELYERVPNPSFLKFIRYTIRQQLWLHLKCLDFNYLNNFSKCRNSNLQKWEATFCSRKWLILLSLFWLVGHKSIHRMGRNLCADYRITSIPWRKS